ncbi:MAG: hypothetical protein ABR915_00610 [Thermoguttaceae bacterium]|jgi:hypothetical protein
MNHLLHWLFNLDPGDFAGADGWSLRLVGMPENFWVLLALLALCGALVWWTIRNYRGEGRGRPRVNAFLAALRLAVLLLLVVIALQPAAVVRFVKMQHSTVVVLLDDTLSMRWADRYGDDPDRARLATLLGVNEERLTGAERMPRIDIVRRALARRGGVLAGLAQDHPLMLFRFGAGSGEKEDYCQLLVHVDRASGDRARAESARPVGTQVPRPGEPIDEVLAGSLDKLTAGGFQTNLGRAIREVLHKTEGRRLAGIVLVSDGQNTAVAEGEGRLAGVIQMVRSRGIPIYSVAVGDPVPPKNIAVVQLLGPGEIRKGSTAALTAMVANRYYGGTTVQVELWRREVSARQWEKTGVTASVALAGGDADEGGKLQEVALNTEAPEVGNYVYKARIEPRKDELITADNEAAVSVRVSDEKVAVLLVSGDAGKEYQFLRNYLLRHPEHFKVSVWQQNADPRFNQEASTGMKLSAVPMTRDELFAYDAVILYDPRYVSGSLDNRFLDLLEEFTAKHHGGLCYIAGTKFTDGNLLGGGPFAPLAALLPVVLAKDPSGFSAHADPPQTAWQLALTAEGEDHPLVQLAPQGAESKKAWKNLPGTYWTHRVERLKTLASALAVSGDPARKTGDDKPEPVIAVQYYGKGRVLYMGTNGTWLWRAVDDAKLYERYWSNVMDFLSAGRLEKKRVLITAGGESFDVGSEVRLRVEAYNRDFTPMEAPAVTVRMTRQDSNESTDHVLRAVKPGFYEGAVLPEHTGVFELTAVAAPGAAEAWGPEEVASRRIDVRLPQDELRRPEANYQALRDLAAEPARFLRIHEVDRLAERIPPGKLTAVLEQQHMLWNTLFALGACCVLLLTEWTVRKVFHMA